MTVKGARSRLPNDIICTDGYGLSMQCTEVQIFSGKWNNIFPECYLGVYIQGRVKVNL